MRSRKLSLLATLLTAIPFTAGAVEVTPSLQVRPRTEKSLQSGFKGNRNAPNYITTQRSRATLEAKSDGLSAKVSVQDVRAWGSETNTLTDFNANNMDVHEAWAQLDSGHYSLRAGRQEISLDGQRLVGAVNWTQQGRSFDGLRLGRKGKSYAVNLYLTRPQGDFSTGAKLGGSKLQDLFILHTAVDIGDMRLSVPLILETDRMVQRKGTRGSAMDRFTGGVYLKSTGDAPLSWRVEGYVQTGKQNRGSATAEQDIMAYMAGARVGYKVNPVLAPVLWVDFLSGDDADDTDSFGEFNTLYATNHKFYGFTDRYLSPAHTLGGGLIDIAVKNDSKLGPGKLHVALHYLSAASKRTDGKEGTIGFEGDFIYTMPVHDKANLQVGVTFFKDQGDFAEGKTKTFHDWSYVQLDVNI